MRDSERWASDCGVSGWKRGASEESICMSVEESVGAVSVFDSVAGFVEMTTSSMAATEERGQSQQPQGVHNVTYTGVRHVLSLAPPAALGCAAALLVLA